MPTDPRFLLKYASRGRPQLFLQRLRDIAATITTDRYTVFVSFDEDDGTMTPDVIRAVEKKEKFANKLEVPAYSVELYRLEVQ